MVSLSTVAKGTRVRFWSGVREGKGRLGTIKYDGVYEIGGTASVYIRSDDGKLSSSIAISHVEILDSSEKKDGKEYALGGVDCRVSVW